MKKMNWFNWFKKKAKKRYFFIETKTFSDERKKVYYNRYIVTTKEEHFPYGEFIKLDNGAVIACFEVSERSAANGIGVRRVEL